MCTDLRVVVALADMTCPIIADALNSRGTPRFVVVVVVVKCREVVLRIRRKRKFLYIK